MIQACQARPWMDMNYQTFRLTAERANRLRHRDSFLAQHVDTRVFQF